MGALLALAPNLNPLERMLIQPQQKKKSSRNVQIDKS
jgi:hypothetical protein